MKNTIIKLGTIVTDSVTGMDGMLTLYDVDMDGNENYVFQPKVLNPKTGAPLETFWLTASRIKNGITEEVELPNHILGSVVEDTATGYKGTAVTLSYHLNGCIHIGVKAIGTMAETGEPIKGINVDLRRLIGDMIEAMTPEALAQSKIDTPSPETTPCLRTR